MKQLRQVLLFAILAAATFSCNKDDEDGPTIDPKVRLLARSWRTTAWTVNPPIPQEEGTAPITDVASAVGECRNDDVYTFNTDFTYSVERGATPCNSLEPRVSIKGDWFYSIDKNTLVMQDNDSFLDNSLGGLANWDIQELTETTLRVTYPFVQVNNDGEIVGSYTFTRTFTAQ